MTKLRQAEASDGNQKWLQKLMNNAPDVLRRAIAEELPLGDAGAIGWRSPRREDDWFVC
jgi:hypothetical protein